MANPKQYLEWHGQQWRVRVKVPARVRDLVGRGKLTHPLHTDSLKEADERKWPVVARLKAIIAAAEKALASNDPIQAEAMRHRLHKDDEGTQYDADHRVAALEVSRLRVPHREAGPGLGGNAGEPRQPPQEGLRIDAEGSGPRVAARAYIAQGRLAEHAVNRLAFEGARGRQPRHGSEWAASRGKMVAPIKTIT
ncbi:DUF6538 domain-containing protein [Mesorhizobium xinjiangense]|uniref:DUF6538 domain-containing protein n=1 Tax=Mesorhizobium xinjiangense TaxID=2678685 RepID=UPI0038B367D2